MSHLWAAFLALLGINHPSTCTVYQYSATEISISCPDRQDFGPLADQLRTQTGMYLSIGPWATEQDINLPMLRAAIGDHPVMANVELRGDYGVVLGANATAGLLMGITVVHEPPDAAFAMRDRSGRSFSVFEKKEN